MAEIGAYGNPLVAARRRVFALMWQGTHQGMPLPKPGTIYLAMYLGDVRLRVNQVAAVADLKV